MSQFPRNCFSSLCSLGSGSHQALTVYSIQLDGCYMIGKNADNVEHLGYWLRMYHFVCHFSFYIRRAFCKFR